MKIIAATFLVLIGVLAIAAGAAPDDAKPAQAASTPASKMFDQLKSLAGNWERTGEGTACKQKYEVIADGSCVMETCDIHGQIMVTMFHMDGDNLMLTHYCMAKNQPRMKATELSADSKNATFTFIDGTNLKSRDVGHMDKAKYQFIDKDHFTTNWTWYEDGKESWMEEFKFERKK